MKSSKNGNTATTKSPKPAKKTNGKKTAKKSAPKVLGYTLTKFCRGLGRAGFKAADAIAAIKQLAPKASESTIRTQVGKAKFDKVSLKRVEIAQMRKLAKAAA
jgi:hypothetical protein